MRCGAGAYASPTRPSAGELIERGTPWLFLHLHEPVPLRQYDLSGECLWELLLLAITGGLLFYTVFRYLKGPSLPVFMRITYTFYGALYFFTFAFVVGRPYITELRRLTACFYRVYVPSEPIHFSAITFPSSSLQPLLQQLSTLRCSLHLPFHEVLDHMVNTLKYPGYVVSPILRQLRRHRSSRTCFSALSYTNAF
ncbi:hypothetical protein O3P69_005720 [Scylla paramamosain]|uniref:Uncharacterized protein n=1 Tax=Scylla paramamosain TaxID=85552 RepID=A0AAW0U883_SCYPA